MERLLQPPPLVHIILKTFHSFPFINDKLKIKDILKILTKLLTHFYQPNLSYPQLIIDLIKKNFG